MPQPAPFLPPQLSMMVASCCVGVAKQIGLSSHSSQSTWSISDLSSILETSRQVIFHPPLGRTKQNSHSPVRWYQKDWASSWSLIPRLVEPGNVLISLLGQVSAGLGGEVIINSLPSRVRQCSIPLPRYCHWLPVTNWTELPTQRQQGLIKE